MNTRQVPDIINYVCDRLENDPAYRVLSVWDQPGDQFVRSWKRIISPDGRVPQKVEDAILKVIRRGNDMPAWVSGLQHLGYSWHSLSIPLIECCDKEEQEYGNILHYACEMNHLYVNNCDFRMVFDAAVRDCDTRSTTSKGRTFLEILSDKLAIDPEQKGYEYYRSSYIQRVNGYLDLTRYLLEHSPDVLTEDFLGDDSMRSHKSFYFVRKTIYAWARDEYEGSWLHSWCKRAIENHLEPLAACIEKITGKPFPPPVPEITMEQATEEYGKYVSKVYSSDPIYDFLEEFYPGCFNGLGCSYCANLSAFKEVCAEGTCNCSKMKRFFMDKGIERSAHFLMLKNEDKTTTVFFKVQDIGDMEEPYAGERERRVFPTEEKKKELMTLKSECPCQKRREALENTYYLLMEGDDEGALTGLSVDGLANILPVSLVDRMVRVFELECVNDSSWESSYRDAIDDIHAILSSNRSL